VDQKALDLLEFPKIRERIASLTAFSGGRDLVLSLIPSGDLPWIEARQREVAEARELVALRPNFALGGVHDVRAIAEQAALGGLLQPHQLQDVRDTLQGARTVKGALDRVREQVPSLARRASRLPDCGTVEAEVNRCIGHRGEVLDGASPLLAQLRAQVRSAHGRLENAVVSR
jgi:DNA mismatch repair protein MutS2